MRVVNPTLLVPCTHPFWTPLSLPYSIFIRSYVAEMDCVADGLCMYSYIARNTVPSCQMYVTQLNSKHHHPFGLDLLTNTMLWRIGI